MENNPDFNYLIPLMNRAIDMLAPFFEEGRDHRAIRDAEDAMLSVRAAQTPANCDKFFDALESVHDYLHVFDAQELNAALISDLDKEIANYFDHAS